MAFSPKINLTSSRLSSSNKSSKLVKKSPQKQKQLKTPSQKRSQKQHTSYELLERFNRKKYISWKERCLSDRQIKGCGQSSQMSSLFRFWSLNLRKHFSRPMYNEFKKYALLDASENSFYGLQCLFRYFSYGLENDFRSNIFDDFQLLALEYYKKNNLYGIEKLVAFLTFNKNNEIKLSIHPVIKQILHKYPTLDHFKQINNQE